MATEKRLIDANYLRNKLIPNCPIEEGGIPLGDFNAHQKILAFYPTVDAVEVVHGRWVKTCVPDIYQCTNCKRPTKMDELCDSEILRAYCPNCGAKMDGERKDNETV